MEKIPEYICPSDMQNFIAYMDTDSIYVNAEPLLKHLYDDFDTLKEEEKEKRLEKIALKFQDKITEYYDELATEAFNCPEHRLEMKTECILRSAYFSGKRRYAQYITIKEGNPTNEIDIKGLDFMKSNFPTIYRNLFEDVLKQALEGKDEFSLNKQIQEFTNKLEQIPFRKLAKPTGVKKFDEYIAAPPTTGNIFASLKTKTPIHYRAASNYNDLIRFKDYEGTYNLLIPGDKIKYVYLVENPYRINVLGFPNGKIPKDFEDFIENYIDREKMFESVFKKKIEAFFEDLGWKLQLNTFVTDFFGY